MCTCAYLCEQTHGHNSLLCLPLGSTHINTYDLLHLAVLYYLCHSQLGTNKLQIQASGRQYRLMENS